MATSIHDLLGDSLFQTNLLLWLLQPPNGSSVRPLLAEAGLKLRSIEEALPLGTNLVASLKKAGLTAKENAAPDAILLNDGAEHLVVECKVNMFGAAASPNGSDSNQRQARSFLLQTPKVLSSALAGSKVSKSQVAYLTRHNPKHDQSEGVQALAKELKDAKFTVADCCVWRLVEHQGGVGLVVPTAKEKWPKCVRTACKGKRGSKAVTLIPRDLNGNDLRPLYFIPWMPESESQPSEYNKKAFGNRILGAVVTRVGRAAVGDDVILNLDEILDEVTLGVYGKWRNSEGKRSLRTCARKLVNTHFDKTGAIKHDPDGTGRSVLVKLSEEKIKLAIIKACRETIDTRWDEPDLQGNLFEQPVDGDEDAERK